MFDWFNNKNSNAKKAARNNTGKYPTARFETSKFRDDQIKIRRSSIEITGSSRIKEKIDFIEIDYIIAKRYSFPANEMNNDGPYFWIGLKSFSMAALDPSSWMNGFEQLEQWLFRLPGFDKATYLEFTVQNMESIVLWTKASAEALISSKKQA